MATRLLERPEQRDLRVAALVGLVSNASRPRASAARRTSVRVAFRPGRESATASLSARCSQCPGHLEPDRGVVLALGFRHGLRRRADLPCALIRYYVIVLRCRAPSIPPLLPRAVGGRRSLTCSERRRWRFWPSRAAQGAVVSWSTTRAAALLGSEPSEPGRGFCCLDKSDGSTTPFIDASVDASTGDDQSSSSEASENSSEGAAGGDAAGSCTTSSECGSGQACLCPVRGGCHATGQCLA